MTNYRILIILGMILLASPSHAIDEAATGKVYLSPHRVLEIPQFEFEQLSLDFPIVDVIFDQNNGLWMIGQKSIWRWGILKQKLSKIPIVTNSEDPPLQVLGTDGKNLYTASRKALFRVQFEPYRIFKYEHPSYNGGMSLRLDASQSDLWWVHQDGVISLAKEGGTGALRLAHSSLTGVNDALLMPEREELWILKNRKLLLRSVASDPPTVKLIQNMQHDKASLSITSDAIMIKSGRSILRYSKSGDLVQVIPVSGPRTLLQASFDQSIDAYLFSDGLLERYDSDDASVRRYRIELDMQTNITKLLCRKSLCAMIANGKPRIAHLLDLD